MPTAGYALSTDWMNSKKQALEESSPDSSSLLPDVDVLDPEIRSAEIW